MTDATSPRGYPPDIVLVRPRGADNIGAVARACKNHGMGRLVLVDPPHFDADHARWMAPGCHDVIDGALFVGAVRDAVADHHLVVGTTARMRRVDWPVVEPRQLAVALGEAPGRAAILFGPEDTGLSNEDMALCTALVCIPTADAESLNLAHAVTAIAVQLADHARAQGWTMGPVRRQGRRGGPVRDGRPRPPPPQEPAPVGLVDLVVQDAMELLDASGYLRSRSALQVRTTLHGLLARAMPTAREAAVMRGMAKALRWARGPDPSR